MMMLLGSSQWHYPAALRKAAPLSKLLELFLSAIAGSIARRLSVNTLRADHSW